MARLYFDVDVILTCNTCRALRSPDDPPCNHEGTSFATSLLNDAVAEMLRDKRLLDQNAKATEPWEIELGRWWHKVQDEWEAGQRELDPPLSAHRLLDWTLPAARPNEILGDLDQRYREVILPRDGKKWADRWYWRQAIGAVLPMWKRAIWNRIKGLGIVAGVGGALGWLWEKMSS